MNIESTNHLSPKSLAKKMLTEQTLKIKVAADIFIPRPAIQPDSKPIVRPVINPPYPTLEKPIISKPPVIIDPSINNPPLR